jgi:glutamyl-tRNA synthetase
MTVGADVWDFEPLFTKDKLDDDDNWEDFVNRDSATKVEQLVDSNAKELKVDDVIQLERKGYYRVDKAAGVDQPLVLFNIPTGKVEGVKMK